MSAFEFLAAMVGVGILLWGAKILSQVGSKSEKKGTQLAAARVLVETITRREWRRK